ncbi:hypothetical protein DOQ08_01958 [Marinobacter litoralis]|uniref:DUF4136 domain-containing protein n=1 Tax=Marinobacter litoralis TaxID=187981 RepID=A0A3M2RI80_9GAMM|nr:hypothetical protein [Marinobacter litoralis]RMJ04635.1 hypothetical protein DOQ08_01958 [Marinobacter litoralis]
MKYLLLLALTQSLLGCAIAFPPSDKGFNQQAVTGKESVYIASAANSNPACHDSRLIEELKDRFEALNYVEAESEYKADLALFLDSECGVDQTGADMATMIFPLASFFILPITTTTEYEVRVETFEHGAPAKDYFFDGSSKVLTHPFYFGKLADKHKEYVEQSTPAMSSRIINALEEDYFL